MGMLLTTSEKAKQLRSMMLDIVIATINEKTGGGTKYTTGVTEISCQQPSRKKTTIRNSLLPLRSMPPPPAE